MDDDGIVAVGVVIGVIILFILGIWKLYSFMGEWVSPILCATGIFLSALAVFWIKRKGLDDFDDYMEPLWVSLPSVLVSTVFLFLLIGLFIGNWKRGLWVLTCIIFSTGMWIVMHNLLSKWKKMSAIKTAACITVSSLGFSFMIFWYSPTVHSELTVPERQLWFDAPKEMIEKGQISLLLDLTTGLKNKNRGMDIQRQVVSHYINDISRLSRSGRWDDLAEMAKNAKENWIRHLAEPLQTEASFYTALALLQSDSHSHNEQGVSLLSKFRGKSSLEEP